MTNLDGKFPRIDEFCHEWTNIARDFFVATCNLEILAFHINL